MGIASTTLSLHNCQLRAIHAEYVIGSFWLPENPLQNMSALQRDITHVIAGLNQKDFFLGRLANNKKTATGSDAEACAFLNTTSLTTPMDYDWSQIYLYVAGQTYTRWGKHEMPADIRVDSLNDYQMSELKRFRDWLYQKRTQARLDRERQKKREGIQAEAAKKKTEQPALFGF